MANFYGKARSNYFKVKDVEAFKNWIAALSGIRIWENEEFYGVYADAEDGSWPSDEAAEDPEECVIIDFPQELSTHLQEGEVAVLMNVGSEKMRYFAAQAVAVNHKGETITIDIGDIYQQAFEKFGIRPNPAEY